MDLGRLQALPDASKITSGMTAGGVSNGSRQVVSPASTVVFPPHDINDLRATLLRDLSGRSSEVPLLIQPVEPVTAPQTEATLANGMEDYARLQRRILLATLILSAFAVVLAAFLFDRSTALSLAVGALAGMLYMRLLARSVARIGGDKRSVGKSQLLVPIVLVLAASRLPFLEIVPSLVGFLLYKPALILQALTDR
ncbi:ATP synthase subunit I [Synechococcus sp. ATX 2A4]|uniref:ATP synthase subunit I n=1 Tax=Synechococcus sp. ATX 2A4 TaxID=2823727 RepID=UPI0020CC0F1A|nr:ATP synthase subunit I [Synechococcus sp. ATX 2A4]